MSNTRIVVIGAAGEMARVGIERFATHTSDCTLELYDLDIGALEDVASKLPRGRVSVGALDLFDDQALRRAIEGASLVVLGAGPFMRTAAPVIRACIAARIDYLDFDDDVESTQDGIRLDGEARAAGVACLKGCGASPGLTNVLAVDAAAQLDEVESIDVCWVSGDEGARPYGAAVLEHLLHIGAGDCVTWREGRQVTVESSVANEVFPIGGGVGDYRLYEVAHPEAVTLPRQFPHARSIRVMGGLHPQPANGIARGISLAVARGKMTVAEAIEWYQLVLRDESGSFKGWRHALSGMLGQVRRRESSLGELGRFLWRGVRKRHPEYRAALMARATGIRDRKRATVTVRTPKSGPGTYVGSSMAAATGTYLAAFVTLALDRDDRVPGVLMPEDWVDPLGFYAAMERVGTPADELVERPDARATLESHRGSRRETIAARQ